MYSVLGNVLMGGHNLEGERKVLSGLLGNVHKNLYGGSLEQTGQLDNISDKWNESLFNQGLQDTPELLQMLKAIKEDLQKTKEENLKTKN